MKPSAKLKSLALVAAACGSTLPGLVLASGNATVGLTFVVLSANRCDFIAPRSTSISFTVNPLTTIAQGGVGTLLLNCVGSGDPAVVGLSGPTSRALTNTATATNTISYSIAFPSSMSFPKAGAGSTPTMTVSAYLASDAQTAPAGVYTDSFTIVVNP